MSPSSHLALTPTLTLTRTLTLTLTRIPTPTPTRALSRHHLLRATYDAYASPLRPGPGGELTRERALLPRGARVLAPQAWLDLCCACGLDKALPPPRLSEALQRAVRDVGARAAPQRGGGVASEPADFVGFVQALIASTLP